MFCFDGLMDGRLEAFGLHGRSATTFCMFYLKARRRKWSGSATAPVQSGGDKRGPDTIQKEVQLPANIVRCHDKCAHNQRGSTNGLPFRD